MTEIERKFLPSESFDLKQIKSISQKKYVITQGYLSDDIERTVRVRTKGNKGFLTIKGKGNESAVTRFEWEKEITVADALQLLDLCKKGTIKKTRFEVMLENNVFEIDVFETDNKGLIIIEIELESENQIFQKPHWLGAEVTADIRYFNSYLSKNPFCEW